MRRSLLIIGVAFAITLAIVFGTRVSADALGVVVGVILGVAASVPATFLIIFVLTRQQRAAERSLPLAAQQPPVVIVNVPDRAALSSPPALPAPYQAEPTRKWTVIGDTETDI